MATTQNYYLEEQDTRTMLSNTKFFESYSRYNEESSKYEVWDESVARVMDMHRTFFKDKLEKVPELNQYFQYIEDAYKNKRILGAQRSLQFGGDQLLQHHMRIYNCTSSHLDRPAFFGEYFYILLCGAGAGYSVQKHHIAKLPMIRPRTKQAKIHTVDDSIEGWATALNVLLSSYFIGGGVHPEYEGRRVHFEFHKIRPKGSAISGGFKAPGAEPLKRALDRIETLLNSIAEDGILRPIDAYDICCHTADAVLSGGVRRAATICLFSKDDEEMIKAKTGNWNATNPQRARSNNSAVIKRDEITYDEFKKIVDVVREFGEPGFVFVSSYEHCFNPCVEIGMLPKTKKGVSGWQGCVKGDTKLLTKTGIVNIGDVIDKEVEIWNGKKWSKVKPFITGYDRNFYRVSFGDGSYLDCTENHKFLVKNRFDKEYKEMTTLDLLHDVGKYTMHVPRSNIIMSDENRKDVDHDYDYGFILGDGTVRQNKSSATAIVYEHYFNRNFPVTGKLQSERVCKYKGNKVKTYYWNKGDLDLEFAYDLKYGSELPSEMFSQWSRKSLLNFFAGWIDTDGSVGKTGCRIYGTEGHIRSAQLLLSMMGINSSVNLQSKRGIKTNFGVRNRDVWYLQITETKDLYSYKKEIVSGVLTKKGKYQTIKSIIPLSGKETSYCFEEKEEHCGVFNNVLTKQCNLVEMNGSLCPNPEAFYHACMCASALATLQAAYTDFKFVGPETKEIFDREALIGVSLTGWMNSPDILFDKEVLKKGAMIVRETNEKVAKLLGINPAARTTCVKPAGNASVLLGTASGIHPEHARKYIRNIQVNKQQEVASIIRTMNPYMVEESIWSEGNADYIISFPVIPPKGSIVKSQLTGVDFLERVKLVQENWIEHGTNEELCVDKTVRHNVSNTVTVKENEWDAVSKYLFDNRNSFTGVSMISETGDKDYYQAPNIEVLSADEISKKWGPAAFFASGLIVESTKGFKNLWEATAIAQSNDDDSSQELKDIRAEWIRRFKKFALNYFGSDLKKTEYCLKDVYILHKWMKIQTNFVDINLSEHLHEMKETDIDTMGAQACYAGACEVR